MAKRLTGQPPLSKDEVKVFDEGQHTIYQHERALHQNPTLCIHRYEFTAGPPKTVGAGQPPTILKNEIYTLTDFPCAVADIEIEQLASSGGLLLPSDRLVTLYDFEPQFYDVIEYPVNSGNFFNIASKEYHSRSGRCDLRIRSTSLLDGIVFRHATDEVFKAGDWSMTDTFTDIVIPAMSDDVRAREVMFFGGRVGPEDKTFFVLQERLVIAGVQFVPTGADRIIDSLGRSYQITALTLDTRERYWTFVGHSNTEEQPYV